MACISASPLQFTNDIVLQFCSWYSCGNSSLSITFLIEKRDLNIPRNQWPTPLKSASNHLSILSWSTLLSYTSIWFQFNWAWFVTKGDLNMPHKAISSPQWNLRGLIHAMQSNGPLHQVDIFDGFEDSTYERCCISIVRIQSWQSNWSGCSLDKGKANRHRDSHFIIMSPFNYAVVQLFTCVEIQADIQIAWCLMCKSSHQIRLTAYEQIRAHKGTSK